MSSISRIKKRERIRNWLTSPLPVRTGAASSRSPSRNPAFLPSTSSILEDALEALDCEKEKTIRELLPSGSVDIDAAFDETHCYATKLQQRCASKTLCWDYKGRQIYAHDQVEKVLQLLNKFKSVGDVVASVDPVHVGLPWAGIRVIIEVCTPLGHVCRRFVLG